MEDRIVDHSLLQHTITARMREHMHARRITLSSVAKSLGCSVTYVSGVFSGREKLSHLSRYEEIAHAIGIPRSELDTIIRNAKEEEIRQSHGDTPRPNLEEALRQAGIIDDDTVTDILRYIDFRKQSK